MLANSQFYIPPARDNCDHNAHAILHSCRYFNINSTLLLSPQLDGSPDYVTCVSASQHVPLTPGFIDYASIIDNLYARRSVAHGEIALGTRRETISRGLNSNMSNVGTVNHINSSTVPSP